MNTYGVAKLNRAKCGVCEAVSAGEEGVDVVGVEAKGRDKGLLPFGVLCNV